MIDKSCILGQTKLFRIPLRFGHPTLYMKTHLKLQLQSLKVVRPKNVNSQINKIKDIFNIFLSNFEIIFRLYVLFYSSIFNPINKLFMVLGTRLH